jgi:hypothetical protein
MQEQIKKKEMNVNHPRPFILIVSRINYIEIDSPPIPVKLEKSRGAIPMILFDDVHLSLPMVILFPTRD